MVCTDLLLHHKNPSGVTYILQCCLVSNCVDGRCTVGRARMVKTGSEAFRARSLIIVISNYNRNTDCESQGPGTDDIEIPSRYLAGVCDVVDISIHGRLLLEKAWVVVVNVPGAVRIWTGSASTTTCLLVTVMPDVSAAWISPKIFARHAADRRLESSSRPVFLSHQTAMIRPCSCPESRI